MDTLSPVTRGSDADFSVTVRDSDGAAVVSTYAGTEPLTLYLWTGEDQKPVTLTATTAAWAGGGATASTNAANAVIGTVHFDRTDTALLDEGTYRFLIRLTDGPDIVDCYEAWLPIVAGPGLATAPATYCSYKDVKDALGQWIGYLQDESDQTGFADAREDARNEFDRILQRHYRGNRTARRQSTLDHLLDGQIRIFRSGRDDPQLQTWLDDDRLILTTPTGKAIRQWNAMWAAATVLGRQIGTGPGETSYQALAASMKQKADDLAATLTVEIDTSDPADDVGDIVIDLGVVDCLRS